MVVVYCPELDLLVRIRASAPEAEEVRATRSWPTLERSAPGADVLVVLVPTSPEARQVDRLRVLRRRLRNLPLVLIVRRDAEDLWLVGVLTADEVIWSDEIDRKLWAAVRRARAGGPLRRFADEFEKADWIPGPLRQALASACEADNPVRTVSQLAELAGRDRRTLWRIWRRTFGPNPPLRAQDFVHWILLFHAASLRAAGQRWASVGVDLGVHEHTIGRLSKELAGLGLRELAAGGPGEVARRFEKRVIKRLLRPHKRASGAS